ncbi:MAG TPA: hypothetical protein VN132_03410, partial [Bdellovibrio sp.]|nr:hypothetical protein [Bdellovibrio sp.]
MRYFLNVMELTFILILSSTALAAPTVLTYQGRILKADGTPLESKNVSFIFQLTNPSGSCVIYQEQITGYSMVNSGGVFDVPIGNGTINYPLSGGVTVLDVFNNSGSFSCGECTGYNCVDAAGGIYNPQSSDGRLLRVQFHDGSGWKLISPDAVIRSVPYAGYALSAQKLGTNVINDFLLKNDVNNSGSGSSSCDSGNFLTWNATTQKFGCAGVTGSSGGTVKTVTSSSAPYLAV